MDAGTQLTTLLITLGIISTLSVVIIILTKRQVKIGMKIWLFKKFGKEPLILRYHGSNKHIREMVIATKGLHETVEVSGKKFLIFKDENGETFFLDQAAMRKRDDDVNEISYNFNSIMPADMSESEKMAIAQKEQWLVDMKLFQEEHTIQGYQPVSVEDLVKYTDPKRLNEFIKLTYLVAKAQALRDAANWEKWVKIGVIASGAAVFIGILVWYNLDGKVIPMLQQLLGSVGNIASGISHTMNLTATLTP
jgi:hypothetical protein